MSDQTSSLIGPAERRKAGHQEVLGETLAKFEFFQHGWHPYSRFLDIDKIDLILRRRQGSTVYYREVQVKFGKLYNCTQRWEQELFTCSSWRFFSDGVLNSLAERADMFVAYVLAADDGFRGDMFIFPVTTFVNAMRQADRVGNGSYRVFISRSKNDPSRWYVRRKPRFDALSTDNAFEVTAHYRNFECLEPK